MGVLEELGARGEARGVGGLDLKAGVGQLLHGELLDPLDVGVLAGAVGGLALAVAVHV